MRVTVLTLHVSPWKQDPHDPRHLVTSLPVLKRLQGVAVRYTGSPRNASTSCPLNSDETDALTILLWRSSSTDLVAPPALCSTRRLSGLLEFNVGANPHSCHFLLGHHLLSQSDAFSRCFDVSLIIPLVQQHSG
ncbi:unnamed protein product [Lota lota]